MTTLDELVLSIGNVRVDHVFRKMKEAEKEIARMQALYPVMAPALNASFSALVPTDWVRGREALYGPHCRELLKRVVDGKDLLDPTKAEMLGVVAEASLAEPPGTVLSAFYFRLFRALFPEKKDLVADLDGTAKSVVRGEYGICPGDVDELERLLRKKMRTTIEVVVPERGKR